MKITSLTVTGEGWRARTIAGRRSRHHFDVLDADGQKLASGKGFASQQAATEALQARLDELRARQGGAVAGRAD